MADGMQGADLAVVLVSQDPARNRHRFYSLEVVAGLFGGYGVVRCWGRIGTQGRSRTDWYPDPAGAWSALEAGFQVRRRRGYAPLAEEAAGATEAVSQP